MNILFYCSEYPPFPTGGIGSVTKIIAETLVKRGHNVSVVGYYVRLNDLPFYSQINGVNIYRLHKSYCDGKIRTLAFKILHRLSLSKFIVQKEVNYTECFIVDLIEKKNIDIFEITDYYSFNERAKDLQYKKFAIPTILRIHGCCSFIQALKGIDNFQTKKNDQRHFERCDYLSAVSQYAMNYIKANYITHFMREVVIYNPIEDSFLNLSQSPESSNVILFIGKLTETKGCYSLLKAFNVCAAINTDLELHLIGKGNIDKARLYIKPEYRNRVKFLGFCSRETISDEIDKCAFACIPSYFENCSMVALEIMARSRALIFTERTSGKEIIDNGVDGFLVNPEDINQIADKINILVSNLTLRRKIELNAYLKVYKNFVVLKIIDKIENFYNLVYEYKSID